MKVRVIGGVQAGNNTTVQGYLQYGGTSFIRNMYAGEEDPERPDRVVDEMTAYSTQYWFYDPNLSTWRSNDAQGSSISVEVSTDLTDKSSGASNCYCNNT